MRVFWGGNWENFTNNCGNFKKKRYKIGFCASFLIVEVVPNKVDQSSDWPRRLWAQ